MIDDVYDVGASSINTSSNVACYYFHCVHVFARKEGKKTEKKKEKRCVVMELLVDAEEKSWRKIESA
jgi:hypothetical protein